jgi:hypothetical protein
MVHWWVLVHCGPTNVLLGQFLQVSGISLTQKCKRSVCFWRLLIHKCVEKNEKSPKELETVLAGLLVLMDPLVLVLNIFQGIGFGSNLQNIKINFIKSINKLNFYFKKNKDDQHFLKF